MDFIVLKDKVLTVYTGTKTIRMNLDYLQSNIKKVVFADLNKIGLEIIYEIYTLGGKPSINSARMRIYDIKVYNTVIKNSAMFGINLEKGTDCVWEQIYDLKRIIYKACALTIYDARVVSIASVAGLVLKKYCKKCLKKTKDQAYYNELTLSFFGGRKFESFINGNWRFDFKSMYGNIMLGDFPNNLILSEHYNNMNGPGFYKVKFSYTGHSQFCSLPIRESGKVKYGRSGEGWYWYDELKAFTDCGGIIEIETFLKAFDFGPYLEQICGFFIKKKEGGDKNAKQLLNSFFGRMAMAHVNKRTVIQYISKDNYIDILDSFYSKNYKNLYMYEIPDANIGKNLENNMLWSCIITAKGRAEIMKLACFYESLGYSITNINTDCIDIYSTKQPVSDYSNFSQNIVFSSIEGL